MAEVASMGGRSLTRTRIFKVNDSSITNLISRAIPLIHCCILILSSNAIRVTTHDEVLRDLTALATSSLAKRSHVSRASPLTLPRSPALSYSMREILRLMSVY